MVRSYTKQGQDKKWAAFLVEFCNTRCAGCCNPDYLKIIECEILKKEAMIRCLLEAQVEWEFENVAFLRRYFFFKLEALQ